MRNKKLLFLALSTTFILTKPSLSKASDYELEKLINDSNKIVNELDQNTNDLDALSSYKGDPETYEKDEKKIGSYKDSGMGSETTKIEKDSSILDYDKSIEGVRIRDKNPRVNSNGKSFGLNIDFDKNVGERTYNSFEIRDSLIDKGKVSESNENKLSDTNIDKDTAKVLDDTEIKMSTEINDGKVDFNLKLTKKGLRAINNNEKTSLYYKDSYLEKITDPRDLMFRNKDFKVSYDVNPYPNENRNFEKIYLDGDNKLSKVPIKEGIIKTGYNVKNLKYKDYKRVCGEIYYPDGSKIEGADVIVVSPENINDYFYYDVNLGDVLIKLPKGALEDYDSIFNKDPMKNALNLRSKLFIRPRTHVELSDIAYIKNFDNWDKMSDEEVDEIIRNYNKVNWKRSYFTGGIKETINHNGEDVVISKQGIDRYDHYNYLGEINIGLDDRREHLLNFKNVSSDELSIKASEETIFNVYDFDKEAKEKFINKEIEAHIDEDVLKKYENLGWEISLEDDGGVRVRAPYNAKASGFLALPIKYKYTNGSYDDKTLIVSVRESLNKKPYYKDFAFNKNEEALIGLPFFKGSGEEPILYSLEKSDIKGLSVDPQTGRIKGVIDENEPAGKSGKVTIRYTYDNASYGLTTFNLTVLKDGEIEAPSTGEFEVVTDVLVDIPFDTKILYDENLSVNEEIVESEGHNGKRKYIYTQKIIDGEKIGDPSKTYEDLLEKEDRVIRIGMKEIHEDIYNPYKTEITFDPTLDYGQKITDQYGMDGLTRVYTKRDPNTFKIYMEKEEVSSPINEKIRYGTKVNEENVDSENTLVHEEKIPFKYDIIYDDSLDKGEIEIVNKGSEGSITTRYHLKNSEVINTSEERIDPINALIKVGSRSFDGLIEINDRKILKKDTEIVYNDKLKKGEVNVLNEGSDGYVDLSYMQNVRDSKALGKSFIRENSKVDPVNKVIEIGTMDDVKPDIPVEVEFIYDNSLDKGVVLKDEFIKGSIETKTIYDYVDGKFVEKKIDYVNPSIQKIRVGSRDYSGEFSYIERKVIPYETEVKVDPTLKAGEIVVYRDGFFGESETLITQSFINGEKGEIIKGDEKITKNPINKIVRVGTKSDGIYTYTKEIGYDSKVEYDPSLDKGEIKIVDGKVGSETIKLTIKDSKVISSETINKTDKADKIIKIGNRDFTGNFSKEVKEIIPFKVQIIEDESLSDGSIIVDQKGEAGFILNNITYNLKNGSLLNEDKKEISRVDAKDHIIRVGKRKLSNETSVKTRNDIGFDVEIFYDNTKPLGYVKEVDGTGMKGLSETETVVGLDGKNVVVGDSKTNIIKNPINKKIIIGTKDFTGEFSHVYKEIVPYKTKVIFDETMKVGEMKVFKEGTFGSVEKIVKQKYTNGNLSEKIVNDGKKVDPVDKIIKVGKLSEGSYVYKDVIKKSFKLVYDETLNKGEKKIIEGKDGSLETTFIIKDSEVVDTKTKRVDPVDTIIKVGSRDFTGKVNHTEHFIKIAKNTRDFSDDIN